MGDRVTLACGIDRCKTCTGLLNGRPCGCACHDKETT